jgi:hypothetical protein
LIDAYSVGLAAIAVRRRVCREAGRRRLRLWKCRCSARRFSADHRCGYIDVQSDATRQHAGDFERFGFATEPISAGIAWNDPGSFAVALDLHFSPRHEVSCSAWSRSVTQSRPTTDRRAEREPKISYGPVTHGIVGSAGTVAPDIALRAGV